MISDERHDAISRVDQLFDLGGVALPRTNPFEPGLPNAVDTNVGGALGLPVQDALKAGMGHRRPSLRGDRPQVVVAQGLGDIHIRAGEQPSYDLNVLLGNTPSPALSMGDFVG